MASRSLGKVDLEVWPNDLENVINLSPKYSKYLCKFWFERIEFRRFTSYRVASIFVVVAAWSWPLIPWPWKRNQFFPRVVPTCSLKLGEDVLELWDKQEKFRRVTLAYDPVTFKI